MKNILIAVMTACAFMSCTKEKVSKPSLLIASSIDPYSGNYPLNGNLYYLIQKKVADTGRSDMCQIYMNRRNGLPYSDEGKIYYNPSPKPITIRFGENIIANVLEFKDSLNRSINRYSYTVVSRFLENGPENERWWSMQ